MPSSSSSPLGGSSACASSPPPPPPRAMKREFAFALQSLSEISTTPGRTRSGRPISSLPNSASSLKRRKRSDTPAADIVPPPTPPIHAEPPTVHGSNPNSAAEVLVLQQVLEEPQRMQAQSEPVTEVEAIPRPGVPVEDSAAAGPEAPVEDSAAAGSKAFVEDSAAAGPEVPVEDSAVARPEEVPVEHSVVAGPEVLVEDSAAAGLNASVPEDSAAARRNATVEDSAAAGLNASVAEDPNAVRRNVTIEDSATAVLDVAMKDSSAGLDAAPEPSVAAPTLPAVAAGSDKCDDTKSNGGNIQMHAVDNATLSVPLPVQDATTPAATTEQKPVRRRFTRSLLNNILDIEGGTPSESQATPQHCKDASIDLTLLSQRRFTRSQLKTKVENGLVAPEDVPDSASNSPPSVKKMEMKMSKKVACLTKHPGNIRELLNTGLLEDTPVMYIIPHSKRPVLKGVVTGSGIQCFCSSCNGSKAVSAYFFEQHAGSTKKHPADYIYLGNGNSLRDVLRACERFPLEALEKTIRSSVEQPVIRSIANCLNCDEHIPPPSQTECVLCGRCLESKQPQDAPTPSHACKSDSSLTPSSKDYLVKKIYSSKNYGSAGKVTNKDTGLHKLVFNVLLDGTEVAYYVDGQRKVDGYIKDQRIYCNHCNKVVSPSAFEAHAGEGSRRKPYDNIFTSNGVSLHELSMKISKDMGRSERKTDNLCRECGLGGDIFPCKICPRSFHPACVGLSEVPSEWYCDNCSYLVQKEKALAGNKNAKAAGRQAGVDSIEQIMKRAIRIVPISDDLGGCALCKQKDFNNAVFDERTVILCDQCEKEYHVGCLRSQWQVDLKELPEGEWFCCISCSELRTSLDEIMSSGAQLLLEPDMDIIRKKHESRDLCMDTVTDIRWQLLSGRRATEDGSLLLSAAVPIFHQSFDPIIEAHSGRDLIPEMVNGRGPKEGMAGQDYSGMYCGVLTLGSTVVSSALLRVMGGDVAELPLVATSKDLQGLGYFQALFSCIERMLASLKVKHFVLPAAHEAEGIWMKKFGFSRIPQEQLEAYLNGAHLTIFYGTANLHKAVPSS